MFFANGSLLAVNGKTVWHTNAKNVEPVLSLVPRLLAFALPDESKRATLKAPRMCIYMIAIHQPYCQHRCIKPMTAVYIIHPMKRPRCLVFDSSLKLRSSQASKLKREIRLCHYVCVLPASLAHKGS